MVLLIAAVAIVAALTPRTSSTPFAPDNPSATGGRALAQVLRAQGVQIQYVTTNEEALSALAKGGAETTLLVAKDFGMSRSQAKELAGSSASSILAIDPGPELMEALLPGTSAGDSGAYGDVLRAGCDDADAVAAQTYGPAARGLSTTADGVTRCFGAGGTYSMIVGGDSRVTLLDAAAPLTNEHLASNGNAALGLRLAGKHRSLVWMVPDMLKMQQGAADSSIVATRPWLISTPFAAFLAVLLAALWRGRRFGPLIAERLQVVVGPEEIARGRARMYRSSRDYEHCAALLRAATLSRISAQGLVPRGAHREQVVQELARASTIPAQWIDAMFYGSAPGSPNELQELANQLQQLENEVRKL
ncbi:DUF4350 domain-containing protein [Rarobacter incanus]|uniref:DUF4350 domain-containing protein n=1 Tax=Rarobacter incanus TaxID=153494 RepID=UPI00114D919D|nr:DUF4350 domain-containing protein [Rarobacter incanus]